MSVELPEGYDTGPRDPQVDEMITAMHARFKATGQVNPPPGSPEAAATGERKVWWRRFWARQAGGPR